MVIPDCLKPHIRPRKPEGQTTIAVKVPQKGRRKVVKRIDATDIAYCKTDDHNMIIYMVDGSTLFAIHSKTELVDLLKSVSSKDLVFFAVGKFYIVNMKHITGFNEANGMLTLGQAGNTTDIQLSRKALKDFFRQIEETQEAESIRKAEKQTVYVREENASSASSGLRGWVHMQTTRCQEVEEYIFEDDKSYLI